MKETKPKSGTVIVRRALPPKKPFLVLEDDLEVKVVAMGLAALGGLAAGGKSGDQFLDQRIRRILSDPLFADIHERIAVTSEKGPKK